MGNTQSEEERRRQEINRNQSNNVNQANPETDWADIAVKVTAAIGAFAVAADAIYVAAQAGKSKEGSFSDDDEPSYESPEERAARLERDNRSRQLNPNHPFSGPGRQASYRGDPSQHNLDTHSRQLNPEHPDYWRSRGMEKPGK